MVKETSADEQKHSAMDFSDMIIEKPMAFCVGDWVYNLYPPTLGKTLIMARIVERIGVSAVMASINPYFEAMRVSKCHTEDVCMVISYSTFDKRSEVMDEELVTARAKSFAKKLTVEDIAKLLLMSQRFMDVSRHMAFLGLDIEQQERTRIMIAKSENQGCVSFGGRSVLGALVVPACEKLNLTPSQVMWGISYPLLKMLMADSISDIYLSEDERKRLRVSTDGVNVDMDSEDAWQYINNTKWD